MADMTLTMTFKAVDEATAVMKKIMEAEQEMQASISAGTEASSAGAAEAVVAAERQVAAIDHVAEAARDTASVIIESAEEAAAAQTRGDRVWNPIEWSADTPEQVAARDDIQNLRDLADQQRVLREFEGFRQELIDGLGGVVPEAVANAITPPEPEPPAWGDRKWGAIDWGEDAPEQAASAARIAEMRETERMRRAFADDAQAAADLQRQLAPLADTANEIADAMEGISGSGSPVADAFEEIGSSAADAWPDLKEIGEAANTTRGALSGIGDLMMIAAGNIAAALITQAVNFTVQKGMEFFQNALSAEKQIEEALKGHAELVRQIGAAYRESATAASDYGATSREVLRFEAQESLFDLEDAYTAAMRDLARPRNAPSLQPSSRLGNPWGHLGPLAPAVEAFNLDRRDGDADVIAFRKEIGGILAELPRGDPHREQGRAILTDIAPAVKVQQELMRARDIVALTEGDAEAGARALGGKAEAYQRADQDAAETVASGAEVAAASPPDAAVAVEAGEVSAAAQAYSDLAQEASGAGSEVEQIVQMTAEVEPVMRASASGIEDGASAFAALDPAAAGAANSVDSSADAIDRAGQSAEQTTVQLLQLLEAMQSVSAARMSMTPITAAIAPQAAPANQNMPGYSGGGYTGDLPEDEIAGFVHGREFVFDADATAIIGAERLAAIASNPEVLASARPMGGYGRQIAAAMAIAASLALPMQAAASTAELAELDFGVSQQISEQQATSRSFDRSDDRRFYVSELASVMEIGRTIMAAAPEAIQSLSSSAISSSEVSRLSSREFSTGVLVEGFSGLPAAATSPAPAGSSFPIDAMTSVISKELAETEAVTSIIAAAADLSAIVPAVMPPAAALGIAHPPVEEVRTEVAGASPMLAGDSNTISVQVSAPVSITGDAPRANIKAEIAAAMEKSGRQLADIIDEELRRRSRRRH